MTAVYVGNATKQILEFVYRLPERKQPITQHVPIYKQVKLTPDFSAPDIDAILTQWGKYGMVNCTEMESVRKDFEGFLISVGKPIPLDKLERAAYYRSEVLEERGKKMRAEAAVAMINTIENETGTVAKNYEISVAEIEPPQGFSRPNDRHIAEGFRAERDARPNMPTPEPPKRARRRRAE